MYGLDAGYCRTDGRTNRWTNGQNNDRTCTDLQTEERKDGWITEDSEWRSAAAFRSYESRGMESNIDNGKDNRITETKFDDDDDDVDDEDEAMVKQNEVIYQISTFVI